MELAESVKVAQSTILAHKMRGALTALGIIIGVASVIGLLAIVAGIRDSVARQFSSLGAEMISVNRWDWGANDNGDDFEKRKPLTPTAIAPGRERQLRGFSPRQQVPRDERFHGRAVTGLVKYRATAIECACPRLFADK